MTAVARLNRIWRCNTISFASKFNSASLLSPSSPLWLWNMDPACWLGEKDPGLQNQAHEETVFHAWITRQTTGCWARSTSLWVCRNLFLQLSRDWNLLGSGISHTITASPKPSFRAPWGWAMPQLAGEMLDGQHQKSLWQTEVFMSEVRKIISLVDAD